MVQVIQFVQANSVGVAAVFGALWALSEALSLFPGVKSNGVFQLLGNIIKFVYGMFPSGTTPTPPPAAK